MLGVEAWALCDSDSRKAPSALSREPWISCSDIYRLELGRILGLNPLGSAMNEALDGVVLAEGADEAEVADRALPEGAV